MASDATVNDLFTWQIGSERPPNVCLCCGLAFDEAERKVRGPYRTGPYIWVCQMCWNLPFLFFPDKTGIMVAERRYVISGDKAKLHEIVSQRLYTDTSITPAMEAVQVPVIRASQKGVPIFSGKMKAGDLLQVWDIKEWSEQNLDGYQRALYPERAREMENYLRDCPIPVVPGLLLALPNGAPFSSVQGDDIGVLELERKRGAVTVVDGQHRLSGFDLVQRRLAEIETVAGHGKLSPGEKDEKDQCLKLLDYELPVIIVDTKTAAQIADKQRDASARNDPVTPGDVEKVVFTVLNVTQKGLRPSLKDVLQYRILSAGIRGIPSLEKEPWRAAATRLVIALNANGSPLAGQINLGGIRGLKRPVQLNSFVTSMKRLSALGPYSALDEEKQRDYLEAFWGALRELFPNAFSSPREFLLLKTIGVYAMNYVAADVFSWCLAKGVKSSKGVVQNYLEGLAEFDWQKESSPLRAYGGLSGVTEAYEQVLDFLAKNGSKEARARLDEIKGRQAEREERRKRRKTA